MEIRRIKKVDIHEVAELRFQFWKEDKAEDISELEKYFAGARNHICEIFVLENDKLELCGFIELNIRTMIDIADDPIAYIKRWYITEEYRRKGHGKN